MAMTAYPDIFLASASPRRRALLEQIGVSYRLLEVDVDESLQPGETPEEYVQRLALEKARAGHTRLAGKARLPVLGADTAVVVGSRIMGKPADREQGIEMLQALSGRSHQVLSAVAVVNDHQAVRLSNSEVTFCALSGDECRAYWDTGEPSGKAGAYAIQGIAACFITRLKGSYSGVMGLPLFETAALLREFGVEIPGPAEE